MTPTVDGPVVAAALEAAGFTHVVWVPDSHIGTWESAILASRLTLIRACREGEAVGLAVGLLLGGAIPVVVIQCTGFFEAGDAIRNAVHDLGLPLKLVVGVRSWRAYRDGRSGDSCPRYAEPVARAYGLPVAAFDPFDQSAGELRAALGLLTATPGPGVLLWAE
jgi:hypothetical protein